MYDKEVCRFGARTRWRRGSGSSVRSLRICCSGDTSEPLSFRVRLVAYHIYDLERRSEVIPWWEVTPDVVAKYKAFAQGGFGGLSLEDGRL